MINPNDFINTTPKQEEPKEELNMVGGTFICQECLVPVKEAILDEDSMTLTYTCKDGHKNEASL
jgi:hypothetical protein